MRTARYDAVADFYAGGWPDGCDDLVSQALLELVGTCDGATVLDLACGHGRVSRELAQRGARVTGVDLSRALLTKAMAAEAWEPLGIRYVHGDAAEPGTVRGEPFDMVVCSLGLSDIDDLEGVAATIVRALRPGGAFVWSILHPCFGGGQEVSGSWPDDGDYADERWWAAGGRRSTLRRQVGANHRTLATYLNTFARNALALDAVREPPPPDGWAHAYPDAARQPVFLVARHRRIA